MHVRGSTIKFTAVVALTVLALSGFSSGRHGSRHHSGGGGGCSSSRQDHDSSSSSGTSGGSYGGSTYGDDDDTYGGGGSSGHRPGYRSTPTSSASATGTGLSDATAKLVRCATARVPYTTVEVTNPNRRKGTFAVRVSFEDSADLTVATGSAEATVDGNGKAVVRVKGPADPAAVDHCVVRPEAPPAAS